MAANNDRFLLTPAGYEKLRQELRDLETRYRKDNSEAGNVNYGNDSSKEAERIAHLQSVLEHAVIMDKDSDLTHVNPSERVTVWDFKENHEIFFDLLGPEEVVVGRRGVAVDSPVGKALIGSAVGDVIEVEVPEGKVRYAIRKIEPMPPQSDEAMGKPDQPAAAAR